MLPPLCTVWSLNKSSLLWQSTFRPRLAGQQANSPAGCHRLFKLTQTQLAEPTASWEFLPAGRHPAQIRLPAVICPTFNWSTVGPFSPPGSVNFYWICSRWKPGLVSSGQRKITGCCDYSVEDTKLQQRLMSTQENYTKNNEESTNSSRFHCLIIHTPGTKQLIRYKMWFFYNQNLKGGFF